LPPVRRFFWENASAACAADRLGGVSYVSFIGLQFSISLRLLSQLEPSLSHAQHQGAVTPIAALGEPDTSFRILRELS
jgi:hypothetical protein